MRLLLKIIIFSLVSLLTASCSTENKPAISIGNLKVTTQEFESAFNKTYTKSPSASTHQEFLDNYIDRKLILKEAEKENLHKDPAFLESVQFFWEQSLLKHIFNKKIKEFSLQLQITEEEKTKYYESRKESFGDKKMAEVSNQIEFELLKEKQKTALDEWVKSLRQKTNIKINYGLLGLKGD